MAEPAPGASTGVGRAVSDELVPWRERQLASSPKLATHVRPASRGGTRRARRTRTKPRPKTAIALVEVVGTGAGRREQQQRVRPAARHAWPPGCPHSPHCSCQYPCAVPTRELRLQIPQLRRCRGLAASRLRPNTHSKLLDDGRGALDLFLLPREHGVVALSVS